MIEAVPHPTIRLKPGAHRRLAQGHPWIYSNEVEIDAAVRELDPGIVVQVHTSTDEALGTALFNRLPLVCGRMLSRRPRAAVDEEFFAGRLRRALEIRERVIGGAYYRLAHAESDGLPGIVIDRFEDTAVMQINIAGMERLTTFLVAALERVLAPKTVVLRNDSPAREAEGLDSYVDVIKGTIDGPIEIIENGARFLADLRGGQKTGWYYDQRDNRQWVSGLARGERVLDCYCHSGGFSIHAALAGAAEVVGVDRSAPALDLAVQAALTNGVDERCRFTKAKVFTHLEHLRRAGDRFGLVIADPPAFVKTKKDVPQGVKGYRKLARLTASLVSPGGYLFIASCSHHVDQSMLLSNVARGLSDAGRSGRLLRAAGAAPDHPVHPLLPESLYLKTLTLALD